MIDIVNLILTLTDKNIYIDKYVDDNIKYLNDDDIGSINISTQEFYRFLKEYNIIHNQFTSYMKSNNYKTVGQIPVPENYSKTDFESLLRKFESSVIIGSKKIKLYSNLLAGEMKNTKKHANNISVGSIDFTV